MTQVIVGFLIAAAAEEEQRARLRQDADRVRAEVEGRRRERRRAARHHGRQTAPVPGVRAEDQTEVVVAI